MSRITPCIRLPLSGIVTVLALLAGADPVAGADLIWTDTDWSGGHHEAIWNVDPEIHPGALVMENDVSDLRHVAEVTEKRGIWSMAVYHDTLFMAAGGPPLVAEGNYPEVITYDYTTGMMAVSDTISEQGIIVMKVFGDTLYIPGPDPIGFGNHGVVHMYNGSEWIDKPTVPYSLHLFDLEVLDNRLYVTDGAFSGGNVWVSDDWGDTYTHLLRIEPIDNEPRRMHGLGGYQGKLYAQPDGLPPEEDMIFVYDGAQWDTLPAPELPHDETMGYQAMFTSWGDSLIMNSFYRMYIYHDDTVTSSWTPFRSDRWTRSQHVYRDVFYAGGAPPCALWQWIPNSSWIEVTSVGLDPESEILEAFATYYGRLYIGTANAFDPLGGGQLYVSASEPYGSLESAIHDFGTHVTGAVLSWEDARFGTDNRSRFRVRSGRTIEEVTSGSFLGPDGSGTTWYDDSGTPLPENHIGDRYFQYLIVLNCPDGLQMPVVHCVTIEADSVDLAGIDEPARPQVRPHVRLEMPRPNPSTSVVDLDISWEAGFRGRARLRIADLQGRILRSVDLPANTASWHWDLRDDRGTPVAAGVYQVQLVADGAGASVSDSRTVLVLP